MTTRVVKHRTEGLIPQSVTREDRADGSILLRSDVPLGPVFETTLHMLRHWAAEAPERVFIAERDGEGWREVSYAAALEEVQALAAGLAAHGIGPDKPVCALSGNGVDHALVSLACQYIGAPFSPVAEQYSLIPGAHHRLQHVLEMMQPGAVFVYDADPYADALALPQLDGVEKIAAKPGATGATALSDLKANGDAGKASTLHAAVGPGTLAKVLFTSGSSGAPKGVRTTQKMMCVNQAQIASVFPFLRERPPRILDWLPWNHVFGGSHNFNMMLANGGSIYVDDGKPTPDGFKRSLENLAMKPGTISFNVPVAFAKQVEAMKTDEGLRRKYFENLDLMLYAGASLPQDVWHALEDMAMEVRGDAPLMVSSWGMTETAPATLIVHEPISSSGIIGVPMPGVTIKLLPDDELRSELRCAGPNIMEGYFRDALKTKETFDEEGFMITGDAVRFVDDGDMDRGLRFDGRISEDFKLLTGTWVHASKLRGAAHDALAPVAHDLVICGQDRNEIGALVFPADPLDGASDGNGAMVGEKLAATLSAKLAELAKSATGSSTRVARLLVVDAPPSLTEGEITAKGNLNPRKVQTVRKAMVERLYDDADPAVIRV
ncbi:feruloyl-CoA synthase [Rhodovulum sp. DZ06]|uniref:feruloyl-CoA synthase n=1 Tax=Rhodovulum sp. DZ06 TaxID=3425126 RepID=UPI003D34FC74